MQNCLVRRKAFSRLYIVAELADKGEVFRASKLPGQETALFSARLVTGSLNNTEPSTGRGVASPNQLPVLMEGNGLLTTIRISRVITSLEMPGGSEWLFRLNRITARPGRIADRCCLSLYKFVSIPDYFWRTGSGFPGLLRFFSDRSV